MPNLILRSAKVRSIASVGLLALLAAQTSAPAAALPVFAHRYGLSCQQCHTTVPRLNSFGVYFRDHGFRLPNARGVFPAAVKVNLAYTSDKDPSGLPKAIVDEIELLSGGTIGKSFNYFAEQYVVNGGRPGLTRDAWIQLNGENAHFKAGQFELPLPVAVESERDTLAHYALYDQTVGSNTFNFFDPRIGIDASAGNTHGGLNAHLLALLAYDRQSATPRSGVDFMGSVAKAAGDFTVSAYRYQGQRNLTVADRFWRQGYAAGFERGPVSVTGVLQTGNDSSADGSGSAAHSSGGFLETLYHFTPAVAAVARYEGTSDSLTGVRRQFVAGTVLRARRNMRFTLEDAITGSHNTLNTALMFAY